MPRQPAPQVPRWRRGKQQSKTKMPVHLTGRNARAFAREFAKANQQVPGKKGAATKSVAVKSGAWRFRRHLPPFIWLACLIAAGLILHQTAHPFLFGNLAGLALPTALVLFTRHLSAFAKRAADATAFVSTGWLPAIAVLGFSKPIPAILLINWGIFAALWVRQYRWRPEEHAKDEIPVDDLVIWERLAARKKWVGQLASPEQIPGGRTWQIELDGIETHIGQVIGEPRTLAAAWHKSRTEVYA
jgi:hypothetical protein